MVNTSVDNYLNEWFVNGGFVNNTVSPFVRIPDIIGNHELCLQVENIYGCRDTSCTTIYVSDDDLIYIPNAFIPDDNTFNDIFLSIVSNIQKYELRIFNRWGQLLFESKDSSEGWDGKLRGEDCKQDVYIYRFTY